MTTIAWDGVCLAADRLSTYGNTKVFAHKIHRLGEFYGAGAGTVHEIFEVQEWIRGGCDPEQRPTLEEGCAVLLVHVKSGRAYCAVGRRPYLARVHAKHTAIGSGSEFAMAAMDFGKSAVEAIRYASKRDVNTGLGVDSFAVKKRKK